MVTDFPLIVRCAGRGNCQGIAVHCQRKLLRDCLGELALVGVSLFVGVALDGECSRCLRRLTRTYLLLASTVGSRRFERVQLMKLLLTPLTIVVDDPDIHVLCHRVHVQLFRVSSDPESGFRYPACRISKTAT